jgi:hypothetical protein
VVGAHDERSCPEVGTSMVDDLDEADGADELPFVSHEVGVVRADGVIEEGDRPNSLV